MLKLINFPEKTRKNNGHGRTSHGKIRFNRREEDNINVFSISGSYVFPDSVE